MKTRLFILAIIGISAIIVLPNFSFEETDSAIVWYNQWFFSDTRICKPLWPEMESTEIECLRLYKDIRELSRTPEMALAKRETIDMHKSLVLEYVEKDCPDFPDLGFMYENYNQNLPKVKPETANMQCTPTDYEKTRKCLANYHCNVDDNPELNKECIEFDNDISVREMCSNPDNIIIQKTNGCMILPLVGSKSCGSDFACTEDTLREDNEKSESQHVPIFKDNDYPFGLTGPVLNQDTCKHFALSQWQPTVEGTEKTEEFLDICVKRGFMTLEIVEIGKNANGYLTSQIETAYAESNGNVKKTIEILECEGNGNTWVSEKLECKMK